MLGPELVQNIVTLTIKIFQDAQETTENGLFILLGLAQGCPEKLQVNQIGAYLKHALESKQTVLARHACGIISDLSYGQAD